MSCAKGWISFSQAEPSKQDMARIASDLSLRGVSQPSCGKAMRFRVPTLPWNPQGPNRHGPTPSAGLLHTRQGRNLAGKGKTHVRAIQDLEWGLGTLKPYLIMVEVEYQLGILLYQPPDQVAQPLHDFAASDAVTLDPFLPKTLFRLYNKGQQILRVPANDEIKPPRGCDRISYLFGCPLQTPKSMVDS